MASDKRPLCKQCKVRPRAVNLHRNNKIYYRTKCERCLHPEKVITPAWMKSGYKLKKECDSCGFKRKYSGQMVVMYLDGNQKNGSWTNLKSVCANCAIEISIKGLGWKEDPIKPDF